MGRGYCYEITTDKNKAHRMREEDLYDFIPHEFEHVDDISEEKAREMLAEYLLNNYDFTSDFIKETNDVGKIVYAFRITKEDKIKYFGDRLEGIKNLINSMTVQDFATDCKDCNTLKRAIDDEYGNTVWFCDGLLTLDSFIRSAEEGQTYYIGHICHTK